MAYGEPLLDNSSKIDFDDCSNTEIRQLLEILLSEEALKNSLPTINQLLEMPIFKNTNVDDISTSSVSAATLTSNMSKLFSSSKTKEILLKARDYIEKRMNEEQKAVS